jgi:hypothetical protein
MSENKRSQATASRFYPFKGDLALERGGNRFSRPMGRVELLPGLRLF